MLPSELEESGARHFEAKMACHHGPPRGIPLNLNSNVLGHRAWFTDVFKVACQSKFECPGLACVRFILEETKSPPVRLFISVRIGQL
jgi:hypothetical protein